MRLSFVVYLSALLCLSVLGSSHAIAQDSKLVIGKIEEGKYGYRYRGKNNHRQKAEFTFNAPSKETLEVYVVGFDMDTGKEVQVLLNGESVGYLARGDNNSEIASQLTLPGSIVRYGKNRLAFVQTTPGWRWGVTDIEVRHLPTVTLAESVKTRYGFRYKGEFSEPSQALFRIIGKPSSDLLLNATGFDIDYKGEVRVTLNNKRVGNLDATPDNTEGVTALPIKQSYWKNGENILAFKTINRGKKWRWGVTDISLSDISVPGPTLSEPTFATLEPGKLNDQMHGFKFNGVSDNRKVATYLFEGQPDVLTLDVYGYDIDSPGEVSVFLNGQNIGNLSITPNNDLALTTLPIQADDQIEGENTLEFVQRNPGDEWGVTDVMITAGCNYPLVVAN